MSRLPTAALMAALIVVGPAAAASPVPVTGCRVGAIDLRGRSTAAVVEAAARRAFPSATFAVKALGRGVERVEVTERGERLMGLNRQGARSLGVSLYAPRFVVAEGVSPGVSVAAAERALGPATLEANPTTGERDLTFADPKGALAGWRDAGCSLRFLPGPGPKAKAKIASVEIETP